MIITVDMETWDPHLKKLGAGWVHGNIQVLGAAIKVDDEATVYYRNKEDILRLCEKADTLIAHNAQYDIGILKMWGMDISDKKIVDTMILAKLNNNLLDSYSLNNLAAKFLRKGKNNDIFADVVLEHKLYVDARGKHINTKDKKKLLRFSMENLHEIDKVRSDLVEEYCINDVDLTYELFCLWRGLATDRDSEILKILMKSRANGIRVDVHAIREGRQKLIGKEEAFLSKIRAIAGDIALNPNSAAQLASVYDELGISYPRTAPTERAPEGNPSFTKAWLDGQKDPISKALKGYKHYVKSRRDFCDKLLDYLDLCKSIGLPGDRIYPEFSLYGATATGRFTCKVPNIQQIPARDPEIGPMIRAFYIPEAGQKWVSCDFSAQESRLQVHYASLIGAPGADFLVHQFQEDPNLDLHQTVADICNIGRTEAKVINLGTSYGMGLAKLADSLGISVEQAKSVRQQYNDAMPYLDTLSKYCKKTIEKRGYLYTLNGRKSFNEHGVDKETGEKYSFGYKSINKLIQGAAADQLINCLIALDKAGLYVIMSVHDEVNLTVKTVEDAHKAKEIMETTGDFKVPMVVDMGIGSSWASAK